MKEGTVKTLFTTNSRDIAVHRWEWRYSKKKKKMVWGRKGLPDYFCLKNAELAVMNKLATELVYSEGSTMEHLLEEVENVRKYVKQIADSIYKNGSAEIVVHYKPLAYEVDEDFVD